MNGMKDNELCIAQWIFPKVGNVRIIVQPLMEIDW